MYLEKMIEVKTFVTPQGYEDKTATEGFTGQENLKQDYIKLLKDLNRAFLKKSDVQEVRTVMSYYKEEPNNNSL